MNQPTITYKRDILHCFPSPYINECTISEIYPADNSDNLECIKFKEMGWQCISQIGLYKINDKVMFIPPESVIPFELSEILDITKYTSKGKIRVTNFRGNRSEGIIVPKDIIEPYIPYIMKWEDPPSISMQGEQLSPLEISLHMHKFYKMPNILNEPNTFNINEELFYSEKIHGTNWRVGKLPHPITEKIQLYVGSHEVVLKDSEKETVYWRATKQISDKLPEGILFFGEIYGKGIQHLTYGVSFGFKFFAAIKNGIYLNPDELMKICDKYDLPCVKFNKCKFNLEAIRKLSEGKSEYDNHIKEGCVFISGRNPERMAKCISFEYLTSKKRTERH